MPNPFDQFDPTPAASGANPFDQFDAGPSLRVTVRPQPQGIAENLAAPITGIPGAYSDIVRSGVESMGGGLQQAGRGAEALAGQGLAPERPSLGPIPISTRLKAVGDILGGLGKSAAGALEYTSAPLVGPFRSIASQPIENVVGIPKEYTEFAAGIAAPIPKRISLPSTEQLGERLLFRKPGSTAPTEAQLRTEASGLYQAPEVTGTMLPPMAGRQLMEQIQTDFAKGRVSDITAPTVSKLVNRLEPPQDAVGFSVDNLETFRQQLGDIAPIKDVSGAVINKPELRAAAIARNRIDEFLRGYPEAQAISGSPAQAAAKLEEARANFSAAEGAATISRKEFRAELRAAAANSGRNISNTMRSRVADILLDPSQRRGYSQAELALMDRIVRGGRGENALRTASNILGGGGGAHAFYSGILTGGVAPTIGYGLKSLSNKITAGNIDKLNAMIRSDSPLGRKMAGPIGDYGRAAQEFEVSPTARNVARLSLASRNLSTNLADIGIEIAPDRLIGIQRPVGAGDQQEQP